MTKMTKKQHGMTSNHKSKQTKTTHSENSKKNKSQKKFEEMHIFCQPYLQRFRKLTGDARGAGGRKQLSGGSGAEQASSQSHGWCAGVVASRGVGKLVPPLSDCLWVGGRASGPGNQLSERAIKKDTLGIGRPTGGRPARRAIWAD